MDEDETPAVVKEADDAYEAIRAINHLTNFGPIPAPDVYRVLGNLKHAGGHGLAQALDQLSRGLIDSLDKYDVYEDDGGDPKANANVASTYLKEAALKAQEIGVLLGSAQSAISRQGYK